MDDSFLVVIILCSVSIQAQWTSLEMWAISFNVPGVESKSHGLSKSSDEGKIVGGYNATIEQHPYQVHVQLDGGGCGGSIISARYILTAAHCLEGSSTAYVRAGSTYSDRGGIVYTSTQMVSHPLFNARTMDYDVAIIDLRRNMNLDGSNRKVIRLPSTGNGVKPGTNVLISGWGRTIENGQTSINLKAVKLPTISNAECSKLNSAIHPVTSRMFCAAEEGKDSCQGDSGGPAVDNSTGVQLGVVSWGKGCARPGLPGVYTDLSNIEIRTWIKNRTGI